MQVDGQIVRSKNPDQQYIPASTIKILTGLMALDILGPEYRFATRMYIEKDKLFVSGEGDPFLTSEAIADIAQLLKLKGINRLSKIILDDSAFALEGPPPGSANSHNPYDAQSGALAVNFNAIPFRISKDGKVNSGEQQTPWLPLMDEIATNYSRGNYRVNVSAYSEKEGYSNILRYAGELFVAIFEVHGIQIIDGYDNGAPSKKAPPLLVYESEKTVSELVRLCLHYSSNFIANQLYLSCGRKILGYPATWKKAELTAKK